MDELYPKQYLYRRVVRAKLYIDDNYAADIDLDKIADEACFSKFHFVRLFKNIYGRAPHQYLIRVRVEAALSKLAAGASVKEACYGVGFDSVQSFAGLFKRRVGVTPAEFRRNREQFADEIKHAPLTHIPNCFAEKKGWLKE
jgi:AraC-like DNA-binding protein